MAHLVTRGMGGIGNIASYGLGGSGVVIPPAPLDDSGAWVWPKAWRQALGLEPPDAPPSVPPDILGKGFAQLQILRALATAQTGPSGKVLELKVTRRILPVFGEGFGVLAPLLAHSRAVQIVRGVGSAELGELVGIIEADINPAATLSKVQGQATSIYQACTEEEMLEIVALAIDQLGGYVQENEATPQELEAVVAAILVAKIIARTRN